MMLANRWDFAIIDIWLNHFYIFVRLVVASFQAIKKIRVESLNIAAANALLVVKLRLKLEQNKRQLREVRPLGIRVLRCGVIDRILAERWG